MSINKLVLKYRVFWEVLLWLIPDLIARDNRAKNSELLNQKATTNMRVLREEVEREVYYEQSLRDSDDPDIRQKVKYLKQKIRHKISEPMADIIDDLIREPGSTKARLKMLRKLACIVHYDDPFEAEKLLLKEFIKDVGLLEDIYSVEVSQHDIKVLEHAYAVMSLRDLVISCPRGAMDLIQKVKNN